MGEKIILHEIEANSCKVVVHVDEDVAEVLAKNSNDDLKQFFVNEGVDVSEGITIDMITKHKAKLCGKKVDSVTAANNLTARGYTKEQAQKIISHLKNKGKL